MDTVNRTSKEPVEAADERIAAHIRQDDGLWKIAEQCIRSTTTRTAAARQFVEIMAKGFDEPKTPDGDRYTQRAVKAAMRSSKAVPGANLTSACEPLKQRGVTWRLH